MMKKIPVRWLLAVIIPLAGLFVWFHSSVVEAKNATIQTMQADKNANAIFMVPAMVEQYKSLKVAYELAVDQYTDSMAHARTTQAVLDSMNRKYGNNRCFLCLTEHEARAAADSALTGQSAVRMVVILKEIVEKQSELLDDLARRKASEVE